jgi:DNA-binding NarL/FixJ family response regulator
LSGCQNIQVVGSVRDGEAAVFKALALSPSVLVTDVELAFVDGITATAQIRRSVPSCNVLVYTRSRNKEDFAKAIASGAVGYCLSDSDDKQLELAVKSVALGAGWIDSRLVTDVFHAQNAKRSAGKLLFLSKREEEVLTLLIEGKTNHEIAECMRVSVDTVKSHMRNLMDKLDAADRTKLAVEAIKRGLI